MKIADAASFIFFSGHIAGDGVTGRRTVSYLSLSLQLEKSYSLQISIYNISVYTSKPIKDPDYHTERTPFKVLLRPFDFTHQESVPK